MKLFLVVVLFCSATFADEGNMGNGGFTDGNMGNGGKTCTSNCFVENQDVETTKNDTTQKESDNSILDFVQDYLFSIFG